MWEKVGVDGGSRGFYGEEARGRPMRWREPTTALHGPPPKQLSDMSSPSSPRVGRPLTTSPESLFHPLNCPKNSFDALKADLGMVRARMEELI